jgi:phosphopantothenoylcysteine decarboxylase/phosphopantothenate--cysteine ligase
VVTRRRDLAGLRVLITAGPTYEAIDPVRFLGNRSSGKMGYAIAEEAVARGADVILVSGPTALPPPVGARVVRVESTEEMRRGVRGRLDDRDVVVMAAANADFRPANPAPEKIKRRPGLTLELVPNPDLAAEVSARFPQVLHVGFALETGDLVPAAQAKMRRKGQDLVVANRLSEKTNPFGSDTNLVTLVTEAGVRELPEMSKREVAQVLWDEVVRLRAEGQ